MKCTNPFLFKVVSFALILGSTLAEGSPSIAGENEEFRFAKRLESDKMFVAAAEEFTRFAEKYPRSPLRPDALIGAGENYMKAGRAADGLEAFEAFLESYPGHQKACSARYYRGSILKALHRYSQAANELLVIPDMYQGCSLVDRAMLDAGECLLSAGNAGDAARVLRSLVLDRGPSEFTPRARYSLSIALSNLGRVHEEEAVLEELVSKHPRSPTAALALLKLADRAVGEGEYGKAGKRLEKVKKDFKEESIQEKASGRIIDIHGRTGNGRALLEEAEYFLERFRESESRGAVYEKAIGAAWELDELDTAISLISASSGEGALRDTSGVYSLLRGRILSRKGMKREAVGELAEFRFNYPRSQLMNEALLLEAGLRRDSGDPAEASRLYNLFLMSGAGGEKRIDVLLLLADIAVTELADTTAALRYLGKVVDEAGGDDAAGEALFKAARIRELIGDAGGAAAGYETVLERFPGGAFGEEAGSGLERLRYLPVWGEKTARKLAATAAMDADPAWRRLQVGVILLDEAGDAGEAARHLGEVLKADLPDSLKGKASYYLGKAYRAVYRSASARGMRSENERKKALSQWFKTARDFTGTRWGELAHRGYLEERFDEWSAPERLRMCDEYLDFYGEGPGRWWALEMKIEVLYGLARGGDSTAVDSALSLSREVLSSGLPASGKMEVAVKEGYLKRMKRDMAGAAEALEGFVSTYGGEPRSTVVLYDLGETYMALKDYGKAEDAYSRCLSRHPGRSLAERCILRKGDCLYYKSDFEGAAVVYAELPARYPGSAYTGEASYREALALERTGAGARADTILAGLLERGGLSRDLRVRVLRKLGSRLYAARDYDSARPLLEELITLEQSEENLALAAEVQLGCGAYDLAASNFTRALGYSGADTCRLIAGRSKAFLRSKSFGKAGKDIDWIKSACPAFPGLAVVLLERGKSEIEEGRCEEAVKILGELRESRAGTEEGAQALYYLSVCAVRAGDNSDAIDKLESFLRESPHSELVDRANFKLGSAHAAAGNLNTSARSYALAAEGTKDRELSFLAWKNLGFVYQELEDWEKAAETWKRVVELFPEREGAVEFFFNLGFSYGQSGQHGMAYEVYHRIPGVTGDEALRGRAHYWAGISLKNLGRHAEAVRELLRVPYLRTGGMWGVTAKLEAASCYELMGELGQAEAIYRNVISTHGENSDWGRLASEALERIAGEGERGGSGSRGGSERGKE